MQRVSFLYESWKAPSLSIWKKRVLMKKTVTKVKILMESKVWWRSFLYTLLEWWKRLKRMRSTATIVVVWIILSVSVCWWMHPGQLPILTKRGDSTGEGSPDPQSQGDQAKGTPGGDIQGVGCFTQTPFLNPSPFHWWYGVKDIAKVMINRESCMALLDSGAQINTIMQSFVKECSLNIRPLSDKSPAYA